jgi:hypothetical protein
MSVNLSTPAGRKVYIGTAVCNSAANTQLIPFNTDDLAANVFVSGILGAGREMDIRLAGTVTTNATPGNATITVAVGGVNVATTGTFAMPVSAANAAFLVSFGGISFVNTASGTESIRTTMSVAAPNVALYIAPVDTAGSVSGNVTITASFAAGSATNLFTINQGIVDIF